MDTTKFQKWLLKELKKIRKKYLEIADNDDYFLTMSIMKNDTKEEFINAWNRYYDSDIEIAIKLWESTGEQK